MEFRNRSELSIRSRMVLNPRLNIDLVLALLRYLRKTRIHAGRRDPYSRASVR